jgi:hypothetical protein
VPKRKRKSDAADAATIATGETRNVEFKETFDPGQPRSLRETLKDIFAIANSGGGVIVVGVDSKMVTGSAEPDRPGDAARHTDADSLLLVGPLESSGADKAHYVNLKPRRAWGHWMRCCRMPLPRPSAEYIEGCTFPGS